MPHRQLVLCESSETLYFRYQRFNGQLRNYVVHDSISNGGVCKSGFWTNRNDTTMLVLVMMLRFVVHVMC